MNNENDWLRNVVKYLVETFRVKAVILFGSRARGDWIPWSDYDLLIISDFKEKYLDRIKKVLEIIGNVPINIEPHPYRLCEALEMLKKGNPLIVDALEEGKILYSTKDLEKLVKLYKDLKMRGLKKTETTVMLPP